MARPWYKRLGKLGVVQQGAGHALAGYIWLVDRTVRKQVTDLNGSQQMAGDDLPAIFVFWHGEHFMTGCMAPKAWNMHVMISRSSDGTMNAIAVEKLGINVVRGAGNRKASARDKGGARAFLQFARLLQDGKSVSMTADIPKVAREVSPGLVRLARKTGRPVVPVCYVTQPKLVAKSWDRASLPLPFTKAGVGFGAPIHIADDGSDETPWCALIKDRLDELAAHGYASIGGRSAFARGTPAHG